MKIIFIYLSTVFTVFLFSPHAVAEDWGCYAKCMQYGNKYPAQCNDQCEVIEQAPVQREYNSYRSTNHNPNERDDRYEDQDRNSRADEYYDKKFKKCFKKCVAYGGTEKVCDYKCDDEVTELRDDELSRRHSDDGDRYDDRDHDRGSHRDDNVKGDDFGKVDFECFKECRDSDESYKTCRKICS